LYLARPHRASQGCSWRAGGTAARVDAVVHAPAAFRRRGVYVAAQELEGRVSANDPFLDREAIEEAFRRLGEPAG